MVGSATGSNADGSGVAFRKRDPQLGRTREVDRSVRGQLGGGVDGWGQVRIGCDQPGTIAVPLGGVLDHRHAQRHVGQLLLIRPVLAHRVAVAAVRGTAFEARVAASFSSPDQRARCAP
ncbi:MAG: hypothetical protein ACRDTH_26030 [Pseudonocardiaceae bacterium]